MKNDENSNDEAVPAGMEAMLNLAAPQPGYQQAIADGGYLQPMEGFTVTFSRELTEHVLRHHELFSSRVEMNLGNVRPLIPLNVDPPQHSKYRKLLDPLFAPKRMDEQEEDITRRVNGFIDAQDQALCAYAEFLEEVVAGGRKQGAIGRHVVNGHAYRVRTDGGRMSVPAGGHVLAVSARHRRS